MVAGHGLTSAVRSTDRVSVLRRGNLGAARPSAGDPPPALPWTRGAAL